MMRRVYEDPRLVILVIALILVGGVAGFTTRASREDPKSQVRWGYVTTSLPGAEPLEVESTVSEPIERALREAVGVRSIESSSLRGVSLVFVRLSDEVSDVTESWSKIQDKLSDIADQLPRDAGAPVLVDERRWGSHSRVIALYEKEAGASPGVLARWAKELDNRVSFVPGTRFTETFGIPDEEILVEIDEETIAATRLTVREISDRIRARDSEGLDATSQSGGRTMPVSLAGEVNRMERLRDLVLRGDADDRQIRLGDVAGIRRDERPLRSNSAYVHGQRAAVIATRMDDSFGIDEWTGRQQAVLDDVKASLPAELGLSVLFNQQRYTDGRAKNLYESLGWGMILVIAVVCLLMGWRAAIPICAALPLTMGIVFCLMIPFGVSLHQMSISGLILALGMLIDNPIIVVDDVQRRLDQGVLASESYRQTIGRLFSPLLGSNVTTILGFTPILLIGGATGEFMEQMAFSVIACLAGSLALSLTVIPVLAAWVLRPTTVIASSSVQNLSEVRLSDSNSSREPKPAGVGRLYQALLRMGLRFPLLVIVVSVIIPVFGFGVADSLDKQFFPAAERDHFHFSVRLPTNASVRETEQVAMRAREIALRHPDVREVAFFVGQSAPKLHYSMVGMEDNRPNFAQGLVELHTSDVSNDLIDKLQHELDAEIPEAQCIVKRIEQGPPAPAPIELRLYGPSLDRLDELGQQAQRILMQVPGVIHSRASLDAGGPVFRLSVDQNQSEKSGLMDEMISQQIRDCLDGRVATKMTEQIEEVPIRVQLTGTTDSDPERVMSLPLVTSGPNPKVMSAGSIADWSVDQQVFSIYRRNATRCNVLYAYIAADQLPIRVEESFKERLREADFQMPSGYRLDFGGISAERRSAVGNLVTYSIGVAALMIAVLVLTFGSFRMAGIIIGVGGLSIGLGFGSLWLFSYPIGIVSIIGIAGMMGLAINDSIVVLNECQIGQRQSRPISSCVFMATRHVLTTSVTTVAGVLPLILRGGVFWPPMMIVIAGGIIGATLLALGFTPACFQLVKPNRGEPKKEVQDIRPLQAKAA